MNKPLRCIIDAVCGAAFTCVVAVGFVGVLDLLFIHFGNSHPMDRKHDLLHLPSTLSFTAIAGLVLGALAGLSSRLTDGRISFLKSTSVIGACMAVARLLTLPQYKTDDPTETYVSYSATVLAAVLGMAVAFIWGVVKKRSCTNSDRQ
jgi:hypothetical protein